MPSHHCKHPTCSAILPSRGYCDAHQIAIAPADRRQRDKRYDATRDPEIVAFYNSTPWKETRKNQLAQEPQCQKCNRQFATEVHHVVPVKESQALRLDYSNLLSLCGDCHRRIEWQERKRKEKENQ